jgi:hypothetical protein
MSNAEEKKETVLSDPSSGGSGIEERIAELERLEKEATPGPFIVSQNAATGEVTFDALRSGGMGEVVYRYAWRKLRADTAFDCALRNNALGIIRDLQAALKERERERDRCIKGIAEFEKRFAVAEAALKEREGERDHCLRP